MTLIKKNILFVCTSNKDRSPALEAYFKAIYPTHSYHAAGINKYYCGLKGTHLINEDDIKWCDVIVFAEDVHLKVVCERFKAHTPIPNGYPHNSGSIIFDLSTQEKHAKFIVLSCGDYQQGCVGEDYLTKAELVLKDVIN